MAAPPPPELMEELVEEILLRFPPDDPASLVRAALVCKLWRRLISGTVFRRMFREFHHSPLLLPVIQIHTGDNNNCKLTNKPVLLRAGVSSTPLLSAMKYSFPTASFRRAHGRRHYCWRDARHGRVLLYRLCLSRHTFCLSVWDSVTNELRHLPELPFSTLDLPHYRATVVCAATSNCDHRDCHRGPFVVVFMVLRFRTIGLSVYSSSEAAGGGGGAWSHLPDLELALPRRLGCYRHAPIVLIGGALYHLLHLNEQVVKYDLTTREVSAIPLPSKIRHLRASIELVSDGDDGGLGFVFDEESRRLRRSIDRPYEW